MGQTYKLSQNGCICLSLSPTVVQMSLSLPCQEELLVLGPPAGLLLPVELQAFSCEKTIHETYWLKRKHKENIELKKKD